MKILIVVFATLCLAGTIVADDPGIPDSLIVGTVYAELGQPYVDVPVFAMTDDSVIFYTMPFIWSSSSGEIRPSDVLYYHMLIYWGTLDTMLIDPEFLRMIGGGDYNHCLNTLGYRLHCWDIRFSIDSLAPPQMVTVDTTTDPVNGPITFGLIGGTEEVIPQFIPGAIYYGIPTGTGNNKAMLPSENVYLSNYPNPFNATTTIEFTLPEARAIELAVYDIQGRKIAVLFVGRKPAGRHSVTWNSGDLPSGIYFARLEIPDFSGIVKMILIK